MAKRIKPLAYDSSGLSFTCKACMARAVVEDSVIAIERNLFHLARDLEANIRKSDGPVPIKVRKRAGLELRLDSIRASVDGLLSAFYDVWSELESETDHVRHDAVAAKSELSAHIKARQRGAQAKLAKDPKQAAKVQAFQMWQEWRSGRVIHKSGAAFARHVVSKTEIENPDSVERWLRQWRRENKGRGD